MRNSREIIGSNLKALVAKEMVKTHGLKQEEAAKLLGTTQPAISQYLHGVRGKALKLEKNAKAMAIINNIANIQMESETPREKIMIEFCKVCALVRKEGMMCDLHRHLEPKLKIEKCQLCKAVSNCLLGKL